MPQVMLTFLNSKFDRSKNGNVGFSSHSFASYLTMMSHITFLKNQVIWILTVNAKGVVLEKFAALCLWFLHRLWVWPFCLFPGKETIESVFAMAELFFG